jgi:phospholipid/cholesterol/gamma-HCH transport system substrate-binding protein
MSKGAASNIKLGIFVLAGLLFLVLLLYMIGRNKNLFGSSFELKARFQNVQGLRPGNNIRYSGIDAGTVKRINILNDTVIEVVMLMDKKMKKYIRKSSVAAIGTDGLMGNKLVNISPSNKPAGLVEDGDILEAEKTFDTNDMMQTLAKTNNDVAVIATEMKNTIRRINSSTAAWEILNDKTLPQNLRTSLANVKAATVKANEMVNNLNSIVKDVKSGKGSLGAIITDSSFAKNLNQAIEKIKSVGNDADKLADELSGATKNIHNEVVNGKGPVTALLKDSAMVKNINESLDNINKGTNSFNEVMDALKHNFLFRGYFKKLEKQKQKGARQSSALQ